MRIETQSRILVGVGVGALVFAGCRSDRCRYGGATYSVGARFPAGDRCNSCTCEQGGEVACTLVGRGANDAGGDASSGAGGASADGGPTDVSATDAGGD